MPAAIGTAVAASNLRALLTFRLSQVPPSIAGSFRVVDNTGCAGFDTSSTCTPGVVGLSRFPGKNVLV